MSDAIHIMHYLLKNVQGEYSKEAPERVSQSEALNLDSRRLQFRSQPNFAIFTTYTRK